MDETLVAIFIDMVSYPCKTALSRFTRPPIKLVHFIKKSIRAGLSGNPLPPVEREAKMLPSVELGKLSYRLYFSLLLFAS
jgi:hypothetical protein